MEWKQIPLGPLQTNAYVLYNENKEAVIFDPGGEGDKLNKWLKSEGLSPIAILLTHAHFDHIGAVDEVRDHWEIPVYLHKKEKEWLADPKKNGSALFMGVNAIKVKSADFLIKEEGKLEIGSFIFDVLETPGHSPGSISYYFQKLGIVFSGDALFAGGIGRTDLPGGSHEVLMNSINQKLMELPENTIVASGHGPLTRVGIEMDSNPFLSGLA
ncbi:MBL fold metallo-hydrolase [Anaerobacillus isosaccharinicus]|uniref:MBL fold metallo-hydrolase n=1 Tax=Anaerobacillus isosaccharinicus TaxID=1532552 RepID=A0A1S2M4K7_9BACI|nr:MBL fold metallo-hydrolase [Anaerobacillus isosaccharinicus]MBA5585574.1 MBL fold metallo-hydrolase [Anaerobacillus isosaccharinicus]QOY36113.1 MBL fold metallo-hydrolase [Anaerobacillus isosaccharinicus]